MTVRTLNVSGLSDTLTRGLHEVMACCRTEENTQEPPRTQAETEAFLRHVPDAEDRDYWIAESGGKSVGFALLALMRDMRRGRVELLVHPEHRRSGHGTALLDAVVERAWARGAKELTASHATEAGSRFAAAIGAVETHRDVRSLLQLPLRADFSPRAVDGYSVRSWIGTPPSELLDSYALARRAISDAPHELEDEQAVWTAAFVRDLEATVVRRERDIRVTVALNVQGEVVGSTELRVSRTPGAVAGTEDTAVVPKHRRRGLGRWIKVESLLRLQADRPDVSLVSTTNAEDNLAMLALNRTLGFSPVAVYTTCVLQIGG